MITIKDVAREAGVSIGSVSNVLNKTSYVSSDMQESVMNAVEKLGYVPRTKAKRDKRLSTNCIGLIIPDINNPFYPEMARGVEDLAVKNGYSLLLGNSDRNRDKESKYIEVLLKKKVDGIVIVKPQLSPKEIARLSAKCPLILVDNAMNVDGNCDIINVDDIGGITAGMKLLYGYGHRRIAFISGLLESESSRMRLRAYEEFMESHGIAHHDELVKNGTYSWHSGYTCAVELFRTVSPPTAIFAANDLMAIGAMKAANERKISIPNEVSIIGYDGIEMAQLVTPRLTTIRQPKYETGSLAMELLLKRIQNTNVGYIAAPKITTLRTEVLHWESVGYAVGGRLFESSDELPVFL